MNPRQSLALAVRQSTEQTAAARAWLDRQVGRDGPDRSGLRQALDFISGDLDLVQQAIDRPPVAGFIQASGTGQPALIERILSARGVRGADAEGPRRDLAGAVLATERSGGACAAARFSASAPPAGPDGFPVHLDLLGIADVAAILAMAYHAIVPDAREALPERARIAAVYDEAGRNLTAATIPGLTARDVLALGDHLSSLLPDSPALDLLTAYGYWDDLAEVASHLPAADRLSALSLLWGEHPGITRLAGELIEALSRVGFGTEIFCPREALVEQGGGSGWPAPHPRSILATATLLGFGDEADGQVRLVGLFGHRTTLPRATLAALASRLTVVLPAPPFAGAPTTDLLAFPSLAPAQPPWRLPPAEERPRLLAAFARAKAAHLLERACRRHELTSLVVSMDPEAEADDALAPTLSAWIDLTQGATPAQRETSRTGLIVVATRTTGPEPSGRADRTDPAAAWRASLEAALTEGIGGGLEWPSEWVPGQPFAGILLFQHEATRPSPGSLLPAVSVPADRHQGAKLLVRAAAAPDGRLARVASDADALEHALASSDGGAGRIADAVAAVSGPAEKLRHLRRQVAGLRRALRAHLGRLGAGDDPDEAAYWRRQMAIVIDNRLGAVSARGRIGLLLEMLGIGEAQLAAMFWQGRVRPALDGTGSDGKAFARGAGQWALSPPEAGGRARPVPEELAGIAARAIAAWSIAMRHKARSPRLAHEIGLSPSLLAQVVDEIVLGAERLGLERRLRSVLDQGFVGGATRDPELLVASSAGAVVNGFLARLDMESSAAAGAIAVARNRIRPSALRDAGDARPAGARPSKPLSTAWCEALARLIEGNVAAAEIGPSRTLVPELSGAMALVPLDNVETSF